MCGILGFNFYTSSDEVFSSMRHRGPDATEHGRFGRFTLGHNRLKIIDLSEKANQPMCSADENYVLVFNGEIYNYQEIKKNLSSKYSFKSEGDSEVILYSYIEYGAKCLEKFVGQFSFAIYDIKNDFLFCARDRLGIKPFNFYWKDNRFIFASEIKAILKLLDQRPEVNYESLQQYFRYLYVPAPNSIFKDVHKLLPGHYLTLSKDILEVHKYWDVNDYLSKKNDISEKEVLSHLDELLESAVNYRMIADVELGSFLSGGIDSSCILYYMAQNSMRPINTYTLGFKDAPLYDERKDAKTMSEYFGTNHHEILIDPNAADLLPKMVSHFDEPFGNPTALLIHELTKETKKHATVALAGDGGDEIFGGYPRYQASKLYGKLNHVPKFFWHAGSKFTNLLPESTSGNHKLRRIKDFVTSLSKEEHLMYEDWVGYFSDDNIERMMKSNLSFDHIVQSIYQSTPTQSLLHKSSITDLKTFLPYNLLKYGDIMSTANSFEVRVPLIDHRIVEFMTSISANYRISNGQTKYILKKLLTGRIPDSIINKPKLGLNPPMGIWLKKDLKSFVDTYLSKESISKRGLLNYSFVSNLISEHSSNKKDRSLYIWSLIVLEEWFRQYID